MANRILILYFLLLSSFIGPLLSYETSYAGACCGGSSAISGLILADEKMLIGLDFDYKNIELDVSSAGVWTNRDILENQQTLRLSFSSLIGERFQAGITPSLVSKSRLDSANTELGDTTLFLGYEILPDWDYHPIRPHGVFYINASLATGPSIYHSTSRWHTDASGKGYSTVGMGIALNKSFGKWAFVSSLEAHQGIQQKPLLPSWDANASLQVSYDLGRLINRRRNHWISGLSIQMGVAHHYQNQFQIENTGRTESIDALQVTTAIGGITYVTDEHDPLIVSLSYSDESLLGAPVNTPLGKSLSFGLRKQLLR